MRFLWAIAATGHVAGRRRRGFVPGVGSRGGRGVRPVGPALPRGPLLAGTPREGRRQRAPSLSYCSQMLSKEVDACVTELLKELVRFQDRMYQKDPVKAKTKRRLVLGLREVLKHLKLRRLKCVIISPNCEKIQSKGNGPAAGAPVVLFPGARGLCSQASLGRPVPCALRRPGPCMCQPPGRGEGALCLCRGGVGARRSSRRGGCVPAAGRCVSRFPAQCTRRVRPPQAGCVLWDIAGW